MVPMVITVWQAQQADRRQKLVASGLALLVSGVALIPFVVGLFKAHAATGSVLQMNLLTMIERLVVAKIMTLQILGGQNWALTLMMGILALVGVIVLFKQKKTGWPLLSILGISTILIWLALSVLNSQFEAHYFLVPLVSLLVMAMVGLDRLLLKMSSRPLRYSLLFFMLVSCAYFWLPQWQADLQPKWVEVSQIRRVDEIITNQSQGQPFQVAVLTEFSSDDPYDYFLQMQHRSLVRFPQTADQLFVVCEAADKCALPQNPHLEIVDFRAAHASEKIDETLISDNPQIYHFTLAKTK